MKSFGNNRKMEVAEDFDDIHLYGELIPTFHHWTNPDRQRQRIRELEENIQKSREKSYHS